MPRLRDEAEKRAAIRTMLNGGATYPQIMDGLGVSRGFVASTRRMMDEDAPGPSGSHGAAPTVQDVPTPRRIAPPVRRPAAIEWRCDKSDCGTSGFGAARVCMGCGYTLAYPLNVTAKAVPEIVTLRQPVAELAVLQSCETCGQGFAGVGCYCPTCGDPDEMLRSEQVAPAELTEEPPPEKVVVPIPPAEKVPSEIAPALEAAPGPWSCGNCGVSGFGPARACAGCGYTLRVAGTGPDGALVSVGELWNNQIKRFECPACSKPFSYGANFCPHCGKKFNGFLLQSSTVPELDVAHYKRR